MDFKELEDDGKKIEHELGGPEHIKQDATEVEHIVEGGGSPIDKAKGLADVAEHSGPKL